jgi:hypothetical protein
MNGLMVSRNPLASNPMRSAGRNATTSNPVPNATTAASISNATRMRTNVV